MHGATDGSSLQAGMSDGRNGETTGEESRGKSESVANERSWIVGTYQVLGECGLRIPEAPFRIGSTGNCAWLLGLMRTRKAGWVKETATCSAACRRLKQVKIPERSSGGCLQESPVIVVIVFQILELQTRPPHSGPFPRESTCSARNG